MILISPASSLETMKQKVLEANNNIEQIEVLLLNLLALNRSSEKSFQIPHEDVVTTIETAVRLLKQV